MPRVAPCIAILFLAISAPFAAPCAAQESTAGAASGAAKLRFVVYLSRHGVRSPTGEAARYNAYSRAPWPQWDVPPGYLTAHGFALMRLFGAYDRALLASEGLLNASGCADAGQVYFYADSDQRTRESGRALAEGMFPACPPALHAMPEGTPDPQFHPFREGLRDAAPTAMADPANVNAGAENLMETYRPQLAELDRILATCGPAASPHPARISLFDLPVYPPAGKSQRSPKLPGPIDTAASLSEIFLLEYAQDMPMRDVGWGCVSENTLRSLMMLHTAAFDYEHRNPAASAGEASNLLDHIRAAMEQAVTGKAVSGALDSPGDRALFLIGHDTNLAEVAGLLHLHWFADGRRDDTPPGSALVFELWRQRTGEYFVRVFYTAQTLDQMRSAARLTLAHPPERFPLALSGCRQAGGSCLWTSFLQILHDRIHGASVDRANAKAHAGN